MAKRKKKGFPMGKAAWFVLLVFFAFASTVVFQEMFKPATNNPLRFAGGHTHRPGRKLVVCAGDDLTRGQFSFDYVTELSKKPELQDFQFVNAGINGDLSYNLLQRLESIISCKPAYVIIFLGSDDLLASWNSNWGRYFQWTKHLPRKADLGWYSENLALITESLQQRTKAKIVLMALPMMGEAINSSVNRRILEYNEEIRKVAARQKVDYISVYDEEVDYLFDSKRTAAPEYNGDYKPLIQAIFDHFVMRKSLDDIGLKNGYLLHSDGIHLNTRGGMMVGERIAQYLTTGG